VAGEVAPPPKLVAGEAACKLELLSSTEAKEARCCAFSPEGDDLACCLSPVEEKEDLAGLSLVVLPKVIFVFFFSN
jgi:hypothetical protein